MCEDYNEKRERDFFLKKKKHNNVLHQISDVAANNYKTSLLPLLDILMPPPKGCLFVPRFLADHNGFGFRANGPSTDDFFDLFYRFILLLSLAKVPYVTRIDGDLGDANDDAPAHGQE